MLFDRSVELSIPQQTSHHASISVLLFGLDVCFNTKKLKNQIPAWNNMVKFQKKFRVWGPLALEPLDLVNPKSVPDNYIQSFTCLQKFVEIAQYLWEDMFRTLHTYVWEEEKKKEKELALSGLALEAEYLRNLWR